MLEKKTLSSNSSLSSLSTKDLITRLADDNPEVRIETAFELARRGSAAGRDVLLGALEDPDWQVRECAASLLGHIGAAWAIEPLGKTVEDPYSVVRNAAIFTLMRIGRPAVVPLLLRALRDEDIDRREDAATAISMLLGNEASALLPDEVEDEDVDQIENWWAHNARRFDADTVYIKGLPASVESLINGLKDAPPEVIEHLANELFDWTGQRFVGSQQEQSAAWGKWWQTNGGAFKPGRRYFHGRDVETLS